MGKLSSLGVVLLLAAACAGPAATPTRPPATATPTVAATPSPTTAPTASPTTAPSPTMAASPTMTGSPAAATVMLAETSIGTVLVGSNGKTLYGFTPDVDAGMPTCYADCAGVWPPLTVTGDFTVGEGLDEMLFTVVPRTDGTQQLQIGDYPLYYYAPDINPGDVNGQGVGGVWYVVDATGTLITTAP